MEARRHSATLLILRAQALFALVGILAKLLGDYTGPWVIAAWLLLLGPIMMLMNCAARGELKFLLKVDWRFAALRCLLSTTTSVCSIYAFLHLPLSLAFTLSFLTPLFLVILAILWIGETVGWHRRGATILGFVGVAVMLKPSVAIHNMGELLPALSMVLAAASNAVNYTLLRIRLKQESPSANILATSLCAAALCAAVIAALSLAYNQFPGLFSGISGSFAKDPLASLALTPNLMAGLMGLATVASLAVISNGEAYLRAEASYLAPFNYIQLFWAALGGWIIWGEVPTRTNCVGALLIIGAGLYTIHRERVLAARRKRSAPPTVEAAV